MLIMIALRTIGGMSERGFFVLACPVWHCPTNAYARPGRYRIVMSNTEVKLSPRDAAILEIVQAATLAEPLTIKRIQFVLMARRFTKPNERTVKGVIAALRLAGHPIGSSRGARDDTGKLLEAPGARRVQETSSDDDRHDARIQQGLESRRASANSE